MWAWLKGLIDRAPWHIRHCESCRMAFHKKFCYPRFVLVSRFVYDWKTMCARCAKRNDSMYGKVIPPTGGSGISPQFKRPSDG